MPKLDAESLYRLANAVLPDDGALAVFNLMAEMHNGMLACDDAEALRKTEAEDAVIAGYYAYIDLGGGNTYHSCRTFESGLDQKAVLEGLEDAVRAMPDEPEERRTVMVPLSRYPSGMAAIAAWYGADGAVWHVVYRHPDLPADRVATILKSTVALMEAERAKRASDTDKN